MPSSHGGGFGGGGGGGGSFGGGFHSSGGSGGNHGPRITNRPFPGATRYSYINSRGVMCFFYSNSVPRRMSLRSNILMYGGLIIFFLIVGVFLITAAIPKKLAPSRITLKDSYYEDNAGIVTNADELNSSFNSFYELTGIQPYLYTIKSENYPKQYGRLDKYTLEDYAYDLYLDLFDDEGHFLIVFVKYDNIDPYFGWIEMHGDNTENIINEEFFEKFQKDMQKYLNYAKNNEEAMDYCNAISTSFNNSLDYALNVSNAKAEIIMYSLIFGGVIALLLYVLIASIKQALLVNGYVSYMEKNPQASQDKIKGDAEYVSPETYTPKDEDVFK